MAVAWFTALQLLLLLLWHCLHPVVVHMGLRIWSHQKETCYPEQATHSFIGEPTSIFFFKPIHITSTAHTQWLACIRAWELCGQKPSSLCLTTGLEHPAILGTIVEPSLESLAGIRLQNCSREAESLTSSSTTRVI